MKQTIYCDYFYCKFYEAGKCTSPILHISNNSSCKEFTPSEEKLNAYLDTRTSPQPKKEYGEYSKPSITLRIRQK